MAMTIEQQRALAMAQARRRAEGTKAAPSSVLDAEQLAGLQRGRENFAAGIRPSPHAGAETPDPGALAASVQGGGDMVRAGALGAIDTASLGFGDEAAAGLAYLIDKLPGERGRSYDDLLGTARGSQQSAQEAAPGAYLAGQVAGGIGGGIGLARSGMSLGANAVNAGRPLWQVAGASAIEGAGLGAAHGFGSGETMEGRMTGAREGATIGGLMGGAAPVAAAGIGAGVRRAISPVRSTPERQAMAQALMREGVDLSAGQRTGSRGLRYAEGEIGGKAAEDLMERQGEQFTSAALRRAGINANRATPEVIDDAFTRIGQRFDDLAANNQLVPDRDMVLDLRDVFGQYRQMVPESARAPIVENITADIVQAAGRGPISGATYQSLRSRLERAARSSGRDPELAGALRGIKETLDDAMERSIATSNPADAGAWREVRNQYRNILVLEKAATGAGENAALGLISPSQLRNATVTGQGRRNYARGQGDFAELSRAGEALMKPMPQSGTAPRLRAQNLGAGITSILGAGAGASAGGPLGAAAGAAVGAGVPRVAGALMMSRRGQQYLGNQVAAQRMSPQMRAIVNALLVSSGASASGRLGSP